MTDAPGPDGPLLDPWPDELLDPSLKARAIGWINQSAIPVRYRAWQLQRWGAFLGVELTAADYRAIGRPAGHSEE